MSKFNNLKCGAENCTKNADTEVIFRIKSSESRTIRVCSTCLTKMKNSEHHIIFRVINLDN